jgi:hypothetical protein
MSSISYSKPVTSDQFLFITHRFLLGQLEQTLDLIQTDDINTDDLVFDIDKIFQRLNDWGNEIELEKLVKGLTHLTDDDHLLVRDLLNAAISSAASLHLLIVKNSRTNENLDSEQVR